MQGLTPGSLSGTSSGCGFPPIRKSAHMVSSRSRQAPYSHNNFNRQPSSGVAKAAIQTTEPCRKRSGQGADDQALRSLSNADKKPPLSNSCRYIHIRRPELPSPAARTSLKFQRSSRPAGPPVSHLYCVPKSGCSRCDQRGRTLTRDPCRFAARFVPDSSFCGCCARPHLPRRTAALSKALAPGIPVMPTDRRRHAGA